MALQREYCADRAGRKAAGVFYTPEYIVNYILNQTLAHYDIVSNPAPKVLDPACGSGNFLVAAYDLLRDKLEKKLSVLQHCYADQMYTVHNGSEVAAIHGATYWRRENLHYHIINHCLYGIDIDAQAIVIAKERLLEKAQRQSSYQPMPNLLVGDSLIKWENSKLIPADIGIDAERTCRLADFWSCKYDVIVGNPPYVSFGLNRVGKMPIGQSEYLRANYPHSAQYKLSYYALFMERSILALKPGGYLGFITPDSYLLGRYYSKIRQYILDTCQIQELTLVDSTVFRGVQVGFPVITVLRKAAGQVQAGVVTVNRLDAAGEVITSYRYHQNYFENQVYKRFRLFFNARDKAIVETMEQAPYKFGDLTKIRTGMRSLTVQAAIKSKERQGDSWKRGIVSSAQVLPFGIVYQGDWLDVNPAKLNKGGWDGRVMAGPKIFLRQTGDSLIGAVDRSGLYHLNNIHSISVLKPEISLDYLVCILNSKLMNFYYQVVTLEKGRSLAQVDIETVEKLPLYIDPECSGLLIEFGKKLSQLVGELCLQEQKTADSVYFADLAAVYNEMNQVVYQIYGISASDALYIERNMDFSLKKYIEIIKNRRHQE